MIDNPKQVARLMQKLKSHLPIPAKATDALISALRNSSTRIPPDAQIDIVDVIYGGDEGGICCTLKVAGQEKSAVVVSLTQVWRPVCNCLIFQKDKNRKFREWHYIRVLRQTTQRVIGVFLNQGVFALNRTEKSRERRTGLRLWHYISKTDAPQNRFNRLRGKMTELCLLVANLV